MPDTSLLQSLLEKLGVKPIPPTPDVSQEQRQLHEQMMQRELANKPVARMMDKGVGNVHEMLKGVVADPLMSKDDLSKMSPWAKGGMLAAAAPFGLPETGIKGLYSRVNNVAESLPKVINPNKLKSIFQSRASGEELGFRKVPELIEQFAGANKDIPKEAVIGHLKENPLKMKVIEKGTTYGSDGNASVLDRLDAGSTQYGHYQMPGAKNYKETLIQLDKPAAHVDMFDDDAWSPENIGKMDLDNTFRSHHWDEPNVLVHTRHNERVLPTPEPAMKAFEQASPTFDGTLGEMREKYGVSPKGRMIENIQSDWHQKGAHQGYHDNGIPTTSGDHAEELNTSRRRLRDTVDHIHERLAIPVSEYESEEDAADDLQRLLAHRINNPIDVNGAELSQDQYQQLHDLHSSLREARVSHDNILDAVSRARQESVPDAPFKDSWAELALKQQLMDVAHRPDLNWLGIAPSSELRNRGEVISPEFQDKQLPNTLAKLLKPFGGKVEQANIMEKEKPLFNPQASWDGQNITEVARHVGGNDQDPTTIASVWPRTSRANDPDKDAVDLIKQLTENRPELLQPEYVKAFIARLTPEMKEQIKQKGFPLLTLLMMMHQQQDSNAK